MTAGSTAFQATYVSRQHYYRTFHLHGALKEHTLELMRLMGQRSYEAIVVYPEAVMWEPQQRPHHLLKELAKRGYLIFFCETSDTGFDIREEEPNLFVLNGEAYLLSALRSQAVIVLCTWPMQMAWADLLPHKTVWYDLVDSLRLFSLYDDQMEDKHQLMLRSADMVSYSARRLREEAATRPDAYYLPNAVRLDDFRDRSGPVPADLAPLLRSGSPIIGYFGAMEEWFDAELLTAVARRRPDWQFVCIGRCNIPAGRLDADNIHRLGFKMYKQLHAYARYFHAAIIPFVVGELTDRVSPVKFYEYAALGLPVVSTPIAEMVPYASEWVHLASGADAFESAIARCLQPETARLAKKEGVRFAQGQQWANRVDEAERRFVAIPGMWKAYANYECAGKVAVMAATFLDFDGVQFYSGGAERYLLDLSRVCRAKGLDFVIYQYGNYPWLRRFKQVDIVSLSRGGQHAREFSVNSVRLFSRLFREQTAERAVLTVYSAYFNAWPHGAADSSVGIIHGVCWDNPASRYRDGASFWEHNRRYIEGAHLCGELVSVDTNSANWFQTVDYELGRNIKVIANYVDIREFAPRPGYTLARARVVVMYPRRLYSPRGLYMTLDVLDRVLEAYPQVEFHFVGNGDAADTAHVQDRIRRWGDRVRWCALPLEEMAAAYREADISLIPTLHSEGTSLSCLEAMACGNAVIATRIGGLADLVIHEFNGLLIEPHAEALLDAIRELLDDPAKLLLFKQRAVEVAAVFSKHRWERKWAEVIEANVRPPSVASGQWNGRSLLIELYVPGTPQLGDPVGRTIVRLLALGHVIYLRVRGFLHGRAYSFGRLQWMDWQDADLAEPDLVVAVKDIREQVNRPVDAVLDREGEWEWISSSPPSRSERDLLSCNVFSTRGGKR